MPITPDKTSLGQAVTTLLYLLFLSNGKKQNFLALGAKRISFKLDL
jgi:hypothetical protein